MAPCPLYDNLCRDEFLNDDSDIYPTGFRVSIGPPQNEPLDQIVARRPATPIAHRVMWNVQSNFRSYNEKGWVSLGASFEDPKGLWLTRLLLTSHGRVLGEGCINNVLPNVRLTVQAEDCSAVASGTASISSSSRMINRLVQGPSAKVGVIYQTHKTSVAAHIDAVNGPTLSGSFVSSIYVRSTSVACSVLLTHADAVGRIHDRGNDSTQYEFG